MPAVGELSDDVWRRVLSINPGRADIYLPACRVTFGHTGSGSNIQHRLHGRYRGWGQGAAYTVLQARAGGCGRAPGLDVCPARHPLQRHLPRRLATNIQETMPAPSQPGPCWTPGSRRRVTRRSSRPCSTRQISPRWPSFSPQTNRANVNGAIIPADAGWTAA